jgi:hypothetical protein
MRTNLMKAPALALVAALAASAPALADHRGGDRPARGDGAAPTRVAQKTRLALKAVDRAGERLADGETARAASQLAAARRALASVQKATIRRLGGDTGPASAGALLRAQSAIGADLAGLFDEQSGDAVDALALTLAFTGEQRDALLAAISALDDGAEARYAQVRSRAARTIDAELEAYDDALTDDTLPEAARAAVAAAKAKAAAARTALGSASPDAGDGAGDERTCPPGHRPRGPRGGEETAAGEDERAPWL